MGENKGLHLLYKKLGETPNERILRFKSDNPGYMNTPMTYAGRLDPMAEGLLLVLSDEEIKEKEKYQSLKKNYEVQVLWGFETDTLDVLGKVLKRETLEVKQENVLNLLKNSIGKLEQEYPAYSSKPVNGKPLFQWAREGRIGEVEIPKHIVEIFEAKFIERRTISKEELLVNLKFKIESVRGDFRQKEIWERWYAELTSSNSTEFVVDTLSMTVSSGFYVRQFVKDISKKLNSSATTFHIKRLRIGEYDIAQSLE